MDFAEIYEENTALALFSLPRQDSLVLQFRNHTHIFEVSPYPTRPSTQS